MKAAVYEALGAFALVSAFSCNRGAGHSGPPASVGAPPGHEIRAREPRCRYDVSVVRPTALLDVTARCDEATTGFVGDPHLARFTTDVRDDRGTPLGRAGARWTIRPRDPMRIRYRVDLDAAARVEQNADEVLAVGRSLVAPLSSYLLAPEPAAPSDELVVAVHGGEDFVTALPRSTAGYSIASRDVREATYGVFGRFEHDVVRLPGVRGDASLDVTSLDATFDVARAARVDWVRRRADAVAQFYGGFPAARSGVILSPVQGRRDVVFGKVLSGGASTIIVLLGTNADQPALERDWVLVHEMFHMGFPSFRGEGRWLDEGLATYAEPLIRARAGMLTEEQGWAEVIRDMPLGVRLCETTGLEHPDQIRAVYWGGAVIALLADVEARRRTNGESGLEDALRKILANGWDATHAMRLADAIRMFDDAVGTPVLGPLAAKYADHGSPLSLDPVLADLGIERRDGGVRLRADAPLAGIRHAIMYGTRAIPR